MNAQTGAEVLVADLMARGVDTIFGLPGVQLDPLFDAIAIADGLRIVHVRHEQTASFMAYGYARVTGEPGVCVVVPGPGVLHAGAGVTTAWANQTPVLVLAGDIFGGDGNRGTGALHEIADQSAVLEGSAGWTRRPATIDRLIADTADAWDRLTAVHPLPAALEVGPGLLNAETSEPALIRSSSVTEPALNQDEIAAAAQALRTAERPVLVIGGGARYAGAEARALADAIGAPIVTTRAAKGVVDGNDPVVL
ncbi:MAG: thiamine pyrophosphate-binding protein, partial [Acidimicrobiales bacterium]